jgi:hypothetical protein
MSRTTGGGGVAKRAAAGRDTWCTVGVVLASGSVWVPMSAREEWWTWCMEVNVGMRFSERVCVLRLRALHDGASRRSYDRWTLGVFYLFV